MRDTVCNGYRIPHLCYDAEKTARLIEIIHEEREKLRQPVNREEMLYCGSRFESDDDVIIRMESADQERLFANGDHEAVIDALYECMKADYWYQFEKDWGE